MLLVRKLLEAYNHQDKKFSDVSPDQWYYNSINLLASIGFVNMGYENHFLPNRYVQRDEMAKMINNVFQVNDGTYPPLTKQFSDVPNNYWAKQSIDRLAKAGLVNGYEDGSFKPTSLAKRAEAATMIYNALHKQEGGPADGFLTDIVLKYDKDSLQAMQLRDFQSFSDIIEESTTGYYKALNNMSADKVKTAIAQGFSVDVKFKAEPQAKVIEKSAFSATVQLNETMEMTFKKGAFSQTTSLENSGLLFLRKKTGDTWKIYDQKPLEQ